MLKMAISDGSIEHREYLVLEQQRKDWNVTPHDRDELLKELGWVGSWESPHMKQLRQKLVGCCGGGKRPAPAEVTPFFLWPKHLKKIIFGQLLAKTPHQDS
jgi:hypothetical protein